jgi:hypothetical protein
MSGDVINGLFETFGAVMITLSTHKLLRERIVRGIHWGQVAFFTSWGVFNMFYYPSIDQVWSFRGGCLVFAANMVYLINLIRFYRAEPLAIKQTGM